MTLTTARNEARASDTELSITRRFNAPRELVYQAWTTPEYLGRWSGPEGFTTRHDHFDASPGGTFRSCLRAPDGTEHWVRGTYRELVPPSRIVFTHAWEELNRHPGPETLVTVTFEDADGGTLMVFRQTGFQTTASRDGHAEGWSSSFVNLDRHLTALSHAPEADVVQA